MGLITTYIFKCSNYRYYIQPQWVFDSVNQRELLPVDKYLLGAVLPPHLSPFINKTLDQKYVPPEELALKNPKSNEEAEESFESSDEEEESPAQSNATPSTSKIKTETKEVKEKVSNFN